MFEGGKHTKTGNRKYLTVNGSVCYFTKRKQGKNSYTKNTIKSFVEFIIKHSFFTVGNLLLLQKIGIPMGIDPAPFIANLYLYHYENKYITHLMHTNKSKALQFKNALRFIDDETNLNDRGVFGESHAEIYPAELELKCEHQGLHATYLDLDISVQDGLFVYKLFDKRDNFPFFIVRMPDLTGNIPNHVFYGSVMSEFLRVARCSMRYEEKGVNKTTEVTLKNMTSRSKFFGRTHESLLEEP